MSSRLTSTIVKITISVYTILYVCMYVCMYVCLCLFSNEHYCFTASQIHKQQTKIPHIVHNTTISKLIIRGTTLY